MSNGHDALDAAKGVLVGVAIGVAFWAVILFVVLR